VQRFTLPDIFQSQTRWVSQEALNPTYMLKAMGNRRYANGFSLTLHHDLIDLPLKWREPKFVFVNSMSDLFHEQMPLSFIQSVFKTMEKADKHVFQILTKRSHRLLEVFDKISWPSNVWMGVTVESQKYVHRISELQRVPAQTKFLSIEPLLSNIPADLGTGLEI